jgi:protein-tyrosine phosphatase
MFVCLGNICRSPTAHGVFEAKLRETGLAELVEVESSGTGSWHVGEAPDKRASKHAAKRGYDLSPLRAQQVQINDFYRFDYILAMDEANRRDLSEMMPEDAKAKLELFLSYTSLPETEVPDPYYGGDAGFEHVLDLIESASDGLLQEIKRALR